MSTQALEHLSEQTLEDYRRHLLSSEGKSAVHDHVADCEDCRLRFKRRLYSTDDERAAAGGRLINILKDSREERLRPEPFVANDAGQSPRPTFLQRASAAFTPPRFALALVTVGMMVVLSVVAVVLMRERGVGEAANSEAKRAEHSPSGLFPRKAEEEERQRRLEARIEEERLRRQKEAEESGRVPPKQGEGSSEAAERDAPEDNDGQVAVSPKPVPRAVRNDRTPGLNNGRRDGGAFIGLDAGGRATGLESAPPPFQEAVRAALDSGLEVPKIVSTLNSEIPEATRSVEPAGAEKKSVVLLGPVNKVIRTDRPTLQWKPVPGTKSYDVTLVTDGFNPVSRGEGLTQTQWTVPEPLAATVPYYRWQVIAYPEGAKAPMRSISSLIAVLDPARERELAEAEKKYPGSHLLLGSLYARAGLLDEAEREFQLLVRENPKSPAARRLLQNVREKRKAPLPEGVRPKD